MVVQGTRAVATLLMALALLPGAQAGPVHLSWAGDGYRVAFEANGTREPPVVRWLSDEGWGQAEAERAPAFPGDPDEHFVASLPPRKLAYFVDGRSFLVADPPGPQDPVRVAFLADMGRNENASAVWSAIERANVSMVLVGGDLSYSDGRLEKWDDWLRLVEPLASRVPLMTAFGNHESYCTDPGDASIEPCRREPARYAQRFPMPNAPHRYYGFDWGPVRFVALDTEAYQPAPEGADWTDPEEQLAFLRDRLQERPDAWNVAFFHRPLRTSNAHDPSGAGDAARADLVPVLERPPVDLVLAGHTHAYERSWAMLAGNVSRQGADLARGEGTVHVTSGGGGRSLYDEWIDPPAWSALRLAEYHFVLLEATPTELRVRALTPDGATLDEVTVRMPASEAPDGSGSATPGPTAKPSQESSRTVPLPALLAVLAPALAVLLSRAARRRGKE